MFPDPAVATAAVLTALQGQGLVNPVVLDDTTAAWLHTVRDERADVLILGDSVVWFQSHGWDEGLHHALHERFGLAGTGLIHEYSSGSGYKLTTQFDWLTSPSAAPENVRRFAVQGHVYTTGSSSQRRIGLTIEPGSPLAGSPLSLLAWGGSAGVGDSVRGVMRGSASPFTVFHQTAYAELTPAGESPSMVQFDLPSPPISTAVDCVVDASDDASYVYLRALKPDSHGATVTSIGLGGRSVLDFYRSVWVGGEWDQHGRAQFLDTIVAGGSGRLLVPIFEGFNDRNETDPSLTLGLTPGDSAEAFVDNIDTLIRQMREDWAITGRPADHLSFIVFGMYEVVNAPNRELDGYRRALRSYARETAGVSFVDLLPLGPPFYQGRPAGLLSDGTHLSRTGSRFYGERLIDMLNWADCPNDIADESGTLGPDGQIGFGDFLAMLGRMGACNYGGVGCLGDVSDEIGTPLPDGQVGFGDLFSLISAVGPCD